MDLRELRVLVTGATGGIGSALAAALLTHGAYVLLQGRDEHKMAVLKAKLSSRFPALVSDTNVATNIATNIGDLNDVSSRQALCTLAVEQNINVLVNSAGVSEFGLFESSDIDRLIDTNVKATLNLSQMLLPHLLRQSALKQPELKRSVPKPKAMIVNIGSTFGSIGFPGYVSYCASKHAIKGFTEALRRELADTRVAVLYVSPRATQTEMNSDAAIALNKALGVSADSAEQVARQIVHAIEDQIPRMQLGWPEKIQTKLNALLPTLVDRALGGKLGTIKQHLSSAACSARELNQSNQREQLS